jgi:hypothetical protein
MLRTAGTADSLDMWTDDLMADAEDSLLWTARLLTHASLLIDSLPADSCWMTVTNT